MAGRKYSATPVAAFGDTRLSASHHRVLGAIAWHDRLGANGVGCYARGEVLAKEANVHYTNLGPLAADLEAWGYLKTGRNPLNRRLRVYSVIYNDNQETVGETTNNPPAEGENAAPDQMVVGQSTECESRTVGEASVETPTNSDTSSPKYIPLSGSLKNPAKPSFAEATRTISDALGPEITAFARQHFGVDFTQAVYLEIAGHSANVERRLKAIRDAAAKAAS